MSSIELPPTNEKGYSPPKADNEPRMSHHSSHSSNNENKSSKLSTPNKQSGIFGASSNLVNSIVGAGIIGIPYALREAGLIAGLLLLALVSYLTDKSLRVIVGLASFHPKLRNKDVRTFEDLASYPFGKAGVHFILFNMMIMAYGAMLAYLLIIKDTIPSILGLHDRVSKTLIMIATSATIMLPLSMQRDMASLSITSLFSVLADVILVGFITMFAPVQETVEAAGGFGKVLEKDGVNPTIFIGLGILSTAMACQHSAFIVSGSLENKTMKRWATVTGISIGISALLCAILGVSGYLGFLDQTQGDVLNNFDHDSFMPKVARFLLAITMFFTYPMESFVARHVLVQLVHGGDMDAHDDPNHSGQEGEEAGGYGFLNRRQTWSLAIYLMVLMPALIVDDLGPVLSITGSIAGGGIAYCGPGLVYLGVNGEAFLCFCHNMLMNRGGRTAPTVVDSDLPIAGDANVKADSDDENIIEILDSTSKPLWWYIFGYPIWSKIAKVGMKNMDARVNNEMNNSFSVAYDENTMLPKKKDYFISIFFIIFGVVSAIVGVASNIYVQLTEEDDEI